MVAAASISAQRMKNSNWRLSGGGVGARRSSSCDMARAAAADAGGVMAKSARHGGMARNATWHEK
jgi:hypothetical protein